MFVVGAADTAEQAEEIALDTKPDFILMDMTLNSQRDGVDASVVIRTHSQAPIMFLTAYIDPDSIQRMKTVNPVYILSKPYDDEELVVAINRHAPATAA